MSAPRSPEDPRARRARRARGSGRAPGARSGACRAPRRRRSSGAPAPAARAPRSRPAWSGGWGGSATACRWNRATGPGSRSRRPSHSTGRKKPRNSCWGLCRDLGDGLDLGEGDVALLGVPEQLPASLVCGERGDGVHDQSEVAEELLGGTCDQLDRPPGTPLRPSTPSRPGGVRGRGDHLPALLGGDDLVGADPVERALARGDLRIGEQVVEPVLEEQLLDRGEQTTSWSETSTSWPAPVIRAALHPGQAADRGDEPGRS